MALSRVLCGSIREGTNRGGERIGNLMRPSGGQFSKPPGAEAGDVVALGRVDAFRTGALPTPTGASRSWDWPAPRPPLFSPQGRPQNRTTDVTPAGTSPRHS